MGGSNLSVTTFTRINLQPADLDSHLGFQDGGALLRCCLLQGLPQALAQVEGQGGRDSVSDLAMLHVNVAVEGEAVREALQSHLLLAKPSLSAVLVCHVHITYERMAAYQLRTIVKAGRTLAEVARGQGDVQE